MEEKQKCKCGDECKCQETKQEHVHKCEDKDCNCNKNEKQIDMMELISTLQRLQAEFENYRKRTKDAEKQSYEKGYFEATKQILPMLDALYSAGKIEKDENAKKLVKTLSHQLEEILKGMKVEKIKAQGEIFNPELHEAVLVENNEDKQQDEILEVYQEGFMLNDSVLRHSVVKINKKEGK